MTTFLTGLDATTAKLMIVNMTTTLKALRAEVAGGSKPALVKFAALAAKRAALVEEHGLQAWAATL